MDIIAAELYRFSSVSAINEKRTQRRVLSLFCVHFAARNTILSQPSAESSFDKGALPPAGGTEV